MPREAGRDPHAEGLCSFHVPAEAGRIRQQPCCACLGTAWRAGGSLCPPWRHRPAASPTVHVHHGRGGNSKKAQGTVFRLAAKDVQRSPRQLSCPGEPRLHLSVSRPVPAGPLPNHCGWAKRDQLQPQPALCLLLETPWEQISLRTSGGSLVSIPLSPGAANGRAPGCSGDCTHQGTCCSNSPSLCKAPPSLPFPGQWQGRLGRGPGVGVSSISLPDREGGRRGQPSLASPAAPARVPGWTCSRVRAATGCSHIQGCPVERSSVLVPDIVGTAGGTFPLSGLSPALEQC